MDFLISNTHISPVYLVIIGFIIGVLGGFFGVGGSFLAGPALFAVGVPMNLVVGTDLAHIVGKSIVASKKHRVLGNVDLKLGLIMVIGTILGVELGAQLIQRLKQLGQASVDKVIGITFVFVLISISAFVAWESWQTIKMQRRSNKPKKKPASIKEDESAFDHIAKKIHSIKLPPMIKLPVSGVERVSLWAILLVAFVGGVFSGFLGGGAGYIRMPSMVYLLGIPTHVAVGTDLFEVVISASYGTLTHAIKGNVDIMIALVMHTGAAIGAQIGAASTQYFRGPKIRLAFVPLPLIGAALVVYGLLTGRQMK
ncbi:MAG TPA: sulfite exporter TauE/SafE family protein [Blastocatellia bacterium]|nr:sulfite exporter TauE/SafE family protein [Blastocatellia bacterium]